jgi:hypothetical protein
VCFKKTKEGKKERIFWKRSRKWRVKDQGEERDAEKSETAGYDQAMCTRAQIGRSGIHSLAVPGLAAALARLLASVADIMQIGFPFAHK